MRIVTYIGLSILLILNFETQAQNIGFTIKGNIIGADENIYAYLIHNKNNKPDTVCKSLVKEGSFNFTGKMDLHGEFYFMKLQGKSKYATLLMDNSNIQLQGEYNEWPKVIVKGSGSTNDYLKFQDQVKPLTQESMLLSEKIKVANQQNDSTLIIALTVEQKKNTEVFEKLRRSFILENLNSLYTPFLIYGSQFNVLEKELVFKELGANARESFFGKQLKEKIQIEQRVNVARNGKAKIDIGDIAVDFTSLTPMGTLLSLKEVAARNKFTLVDFWASWCFPCRQENPALKTLYAKYKKAGFGILGVSFDKNDKSWKDAIIEDGLTWSHISDLKGWDSWPAKLYDIKSIPQTLLLDAEGRIIARGLRGKELGERLKMLLGEKE